jgi:hypothetical protein
VGVRRRVGTELVKTKTKQGTLYLGRDLAKQKLYRAKELRIEGLVGCWRGRGCMSPESVRTPVWLGAPWWSSSTQGWSRNKCPEWLAAALRGPLELETFGKHRALCLQLLMISSLEKKLNFNMATFTDGYVNDIWQNHGEKNT